MGCTWIILASGESLPQSIAEVDLTGQHVMTINSSWRMAPGAAVHYSNDHDWWQHETDFRGTGRRMCGSAITIPGVDNSYRFDKKARGLCLSPGRIAWGGNSGYAGINLAVQFGASRILIAGFDMCGKSHWHGDHHPRIRKPFNFRMWLQRFDELARDCRRQRIEVINCSARTELKCFPKRKLSEVL